MQKVFCLCDCHLRLRLGKEQVMGSKAMITRPGLAILGLNQEEQMNEKRCASLQVHLDS